MPYHKDTAAIINKKKKKKKKKKKSTYLCNIIYVETESSIVKPVAGIILISGNALKRNINTQYNKIWQHIQKW